MGVHRCAASFKLVRFFCRPLFIRRYEATISSDTGDTPGCFPSSSSSLGASGPLMKNISPTISCHILIRLSIVYGSVLNFECLKRERVKSKADVMAGKSLEIPLVPWWISWFGPGLLRSSNAAPPSPVYPPFGPRMLVKQQEVRVFFCSALGIDLNVSVQSSFPHRSSVLIYLKLSPYAGRLGRAGPMNLK